MHLKPTALERAFAIARSGEAYTFSDLGRILKREGYTEADLQQLTGLTLSRQLKAAATAARQPSGVTSPTLQGPLVGAG